MVQPNPSLNTYNLDFYHATLTRIFENTKKTHRQSNLNKKKILNENQKFSKTPIFAPFCRKCISQKLWLKLMAVFFSVGYSVDNLSLIVSTFINGFLLPIFILLNKVKSAVVFFYQYQKTSLFYNGISIFNLRIQK